jgi:hypothetical protein
VGGTAVQLARDEVAYLAAYLSRVTGWDERSAVRVQARGTVVGVFAPSPLDVLTLVALPLAATLDDPVDRTVSAGRLRDIIGDVAQLGATTSLALPDEVTGSAALAVLPPTSPWAPGERGMAGDLTPRIDAAVAEFRDSVPRSGSIHAELVAEATWDRPGWGGLPMRALHAARLLGFLNHPGARVETATTPGWKRLVTPAGQVFVRSTAGPARLTLVPQQS